MLLKINPKRFSWEWCFLQGSGFEVYYQKGDDDPILLGKNSGGDDGFCPFKAGMYEFAQDGNYVTIKWCFHPSNDTWRCETFELPQ